MNNASAPAASNSSLTFDAIIVGGGIAGLWTLDRLRTAGYKVVLLTDRALGEGQTLASQGMIHGGIKYTLSGALNQASETIADMPDYWQRCLNGTGDVDLSQTHCLSDHFYMWSNSTLGKLTSFFASRAVRGRVDKVPASERPALLQNRQFKGSLYRLVDRVLDVPSLLANLAANNQGHIYQLDQIAQRLHKDATNNAYLKLNNTGEPITLKAKRWIFTAGKGNADLLAALGCQQPAMQLRPLQQLVVRHRYPYPFYGHCLGADKTPRLTISSHPSNNGDTVWYLGGSLAEKGASMSAAELIAAGRLELTELFPWLDFSDADFSTLPIERAEPLQQNFARPDNAFAKPASDVANVLVGWPTKLTLAPNLANQILAQLPKPDTAIATNNAINDLAQQLPTPVVAPLPWEALRD
ncbi:FAD-dependent oxidoreductase [Gilvimarinus polysaccharolyticus]|uniref:FAD-dependent oxidoreductase n=1 Tax=Gilvimarinus polysaccharolyticus TaxID=863921 RepID=UPI00067312EE|nr:FAD-dependent oxidoreductase [Gilvimarinus polysaccharolyticus]